MRTTGILTISLDANGTLWDYESVQRHSLLYVIRYLEETKPRIASTLTVEKMAETRNRVSADLKFRVTNVDEVRLQAMRESLSESGIEDDALAIRMNQIYMEHRYEDMELFPEVLPTLQTLRKNHSLGILSNRTSYPERCGLDDVFGFIVFSHYCGVEKPDPRIFEITLERAGCSRLEMLHVGDSLKDDVSGANGAGVKSVWSIGTG